MLAQRLRRWTNINTAMGKRLELVQERVHYTMPTLDYVQVEFYSDDIDVGLNRDLV